MAHRGRARENASRDDAAQACCLYIDEQGALRIEDVRRKARQIKARAGIGLLIVDYLQLMVGSGEQEISAISGALWALAKELRIPVIALSQLFSQVRRAAQQAPGDV